jgi:alginate O-acetyltransferase complex protein AlgI
MIISIFNDFFHSKGIDKFQRENNDAMAKLLLITSVMVNLGLLGFFKYSNFLIENINVWFNTSLNLLELSLPIGISFYTFQTMSYTIDVYRKNVKVQNNILTLATYVTLFPQLIAGPIVRYITIEDELENRKETFAQFASGLRRFIIGLAKKVIIANQMAIVADIMFDMDPSGLSIGMAWLGLIAYTFQIYFDFSGYSDMAIGLGKMFGFNFLENFNYPYISKSITDFWRRWHISLSSWFRDYVYIPLGGNRVSTFKAVRNILFVWLLTGFWHGAAWNFIIWGVYFAIILLIEKYTIVGKIINIKYLNHIYAIALFMFGWVIFRATSLEHIMTYTNALFNGYALVDLNRFKLLDVLYLWPFFGLALVGATPIVKNFYLKHKHNTKFLIAFDVYLVIILLISIMFLTNDTYNPFIYFRF